MLIKLLDSKSQRVLRSSKVAGPWKLWNGTLCSNGLGQGEPHCISIISNWESITNTNITKKKELQGRYCHSKIKSADHLKRMTEGKKKKYYHD